MLNLNIIIILNIFIDYYYINFILLLKYCLFIMLFIYNILSLHNTLHIVTYISLHNKNI